MPDKGLGRFLYPPYGVNTHNFRKNTPASFPDNPPTSSQGVLNVAFSVHA